MMTSQYGEEGVLKNSTGKIILRGKPKIGEGTTVTGPSYFGDSVSVGSGSSISGSAIYGDCRIGRNVEIVDSVVMDSEIGFIFSILIEMQREINALLGKR